MRERHITIGTSAGSPRTKRFVIGSLGIVLTVTATTGAALAARDSSGSQTSRQSHIFQTIKTSQSYQPPKTSDATADTTHTSSATVSINGETVQVNGDGSYDRLYTSDNGSSHVSVSIHNTSSSTGSSADGSEAAME